MKVAMCAENYHIDDSKFDLFNEFRHKLFIQESIYGKTLCMMDGFSVSIFLKPGESEKLVYVNAGSRQFQKNLKEIGVL